MTAMEVQHGGNHYTRMKIQPVEFILSNGMGFCEGSVVKYVSRWRGKGGMEDLRKAKHFIEIMLEAPWYVVLLKRIRSVVSSPSGEPGVIGPKRYCKENGIAGFEADVIRAIWIWNLSPSKDHLVDANIYVGGLIDSLVAEEAKTFGG